MDDYKGSPALDAGLLSAAQSVEHYEISRYGTLIAWANELGLTEAWRSFMALIRFGSFMRNADELPSRRPTKSAFVSPRHCRLRSIAFCVASRESRT